MSLDFFASFPRLSTPQMVWKEAAKHRPLLRLEMIPHLTILQVPQQNSPLISQLVSRFNLDAGEAVAPTLFDQVKGGTFSTDDAAARSAGEALGCSVLGTIGIVLRGFRKGLRSLSETNQLLVDLPARSSLHIRRFLPQMIIAQLPAT